MQAPQDPLKAKKVREIFEQAFDLPENQRAEFLKKTCGKDLEILEKVQWLLKQEGPARSRLKKIEEELIWPSIKSFKEDPTILDDWWTGQEGMEYKKDDSLNGKTISHFKILEPIGRGGMGMVYKAHDLLLERTVALKFLPPSFNADQVIMDRFINEAKVACGIEHQNIAAVYEIGATEDKQMFIAMGYYTGDTLKRKIEKGPIPPGKAIDYAIQLASALEIVHARDIIHRDIKPGNLIITEEGTLKLLDFGLAKLSFESGFTQAGQMVGTVAYMSPEQARGDELNYLTDIWSLGIVLYEMLTGSRPFDRENASATMHAILEHNPKQPAMPKERIPDALKEIIGACLAKNRVHRYQSARVLIDDLEQAKTGTSSIKRGGWRTWHGFAKKRKQLRTFGFVTSITAGAIMCYLLLVGPVIRETRVKGVSFKKITEGPIVEEKQAWMSALSWADFDGDGMVDVVFAEKNIGSTLRLYRNLGNTAFERIMGEQLDTNRNEPGQVAWADQDNDGDLDLFISTGKNFPSAFYRNDGNRIFSKITTGKWVNRIGYANFPAWCDIDNDGLLDLYVGEEGDSTDFIYRNRGDGTMEELATGVSEMKGLALGSLWTDYDNDGDMDLFVSGKSKVQFRNDGQGNFTWIPADKGGIHFNGGDLKLFCADYDNDGDMDLLYNTTGKAIGSHLFRNDGLDGFLHVPNVLSSEGIVNANGSAWGDYDNDGFLDLLVTHDQGNNLLYHNEGDGTFKRITRDPIVDESLSSSNCAWVDIDNDGDLDLFVVNGLWSPTPESCSLFLNTGGTNNWIGIKLIGTVSNRSAIGAKVRVSAKINGNEVTQLRQVGGLSSCAPDLRTHFGLGMAKVVEKVRVEWPSGIVQELTTVAINQYITITEDKLNHPLESPAERKNH